MKRRTQFSTSKTITKHNSKTISTSFTRHSHSYFHTKNKIISKTNKTNQTPIVRSKTEECFFFFFFFFSHKYQPRNSNFYVIELISTKVFQIEKQEHLRVFFHGWVDFTAVLPYMDEKKNICEYSSMDEFSCTCHLF